MAALHFSPQREGNTDNIKSEKVCVPFCQWVDFFRPLARLAG